MSLSKYFKFLNKIIHLNKISNPNYLDLSKFRILNDKQYTLILLYQYRIQINMSLHINYLINNNLIGMLSNYQQLNHIIDIKVNILSINDLCYLSSILQGTQVDTFLNIKSYFLYNFSIKSNKDQYIVNMLNHMRYIHLIYNQDRIQFHNNLGIHQNFIIYKIQQSNLYINLDFNNYCIIKSILHKFYQNLIYKIHQGKYLSKLH